MPIVGVVENMNGFVCPKCKTKSDIFPASTGGARQMCTDMDVPFIGALPIDPQLTKACDQGLNFVEDFADSDATKALHGIVDNIDKFYGN